MTKINNNVNIQNELTEDDIAIIGMVGQFPDADNLEQFWTNLRGGVESVRPVSHEVLKTGELSDFVSEDENFVYAEAFLDSEKVKMFDAKFFDMSPREAEIVDPQHRMFLELCWELFELSGYSVEQYDGRVGVFGSSAYSGYIENFSQELLQEAGVFQVQLGNDKDFLSTRVSYKMGFTGPSVNVNTLCSSAAVGIHLARESLLNYQSDYVLTGGVNMSFSQTGTSYYHEGGIGADEGHCRAYDENASGTVAGSGIGIIAMKRYEDAVKDGDTIVAIIKGTAVNNDGSNKASYTAPSPDGQAEVIAECIAVADISPETISYIDGHGTGTYIGDPIEISGLTKAYRQYTDKKQYCGIGSVKTNIGHLVTAGGVASLIKTVLALQNKQIPPSLNFDKPNPKIDFVNSPFYVTDKLQNWNPTDFPRRAAISSFGIGGTNVHIILQEAPEQKQTKSSEKEKIIVLSAKSENALDNMKKNLLNYLNNNSVVNLDDVSFTLQKGRNNFAHKFSCVCRTVDELKKSLVNIGPTISRKQKKIERSVCFMFTGQGSQYQKMAEELYKSEEVFRTVIDECFELTEKYHGFNLSEILFPESRVIPCPLEDTKYAQLSLFVIEYALAKLFMSFGVTPTSMIGHSLGEYVAACLADVFSLKDVIFLIGERGRLMSEQPQGDMISVALSENEILEHISNKVDVAAVNSEKNIVLSGEKNYIVQLSQELEEKNIAVTHLKTSHAFHSSMMDKIHSAFIKCFDNITLNQPKIAFISNVTANWITDEQATSADYWAKHLRNKVDFFNGIKTLSEDENIIFMEVGPGSTLSSLTKMTLEDKSRVISTLPKHNEDISSCYQFKYALASLWSLGLEMEWTKFHDSERKRIPLPTYPFDHKPYWVEPSGSLDVNYNADVKLQDSQDLETGQFENDLFSSGKIQIDINWDKESMPSQKQHLEAILGLRTQLKGICDDLSNSSGVRFELSTLDLIKITAGNVLHEENKKTIVPKNSRPNIDTKYVEPSGELEQKLSKDWESALGFSPVGVNDNFFDLGGHSLIAATLVNQLRQNYDIVIELTELLEYPTIKTLSEFIEARSWVTSDTLSEDSDNQSEGEKLVL